MIEVIAQQKNIVLPALLFSFIFVIGNFMLLNLFLAILLKAITTQNENDEEGEDADAAKATENVAKEMLDGENKKTEGAEGEVKPEALPAPEPPKEE